MKQASGGRGDPSLFIVFFSRIIVKGPGGWAGEAGNGGILFPSPNM